MTLRFIRAFLFTVEGHLFRGRFGDAFYLVLYVHILPDQLMGIECLICGSRQTRYSRPFHF